MSTLIANINLRLNSRFATAVDDYAERNKLSRNAALVRLIEVGLIEEAGRDPHQPKESGKNRV